MSKSVEKPQGRDFPAATAGQRVFFLSKTLPGIFDKSGMTTRNRGFFSKIKNRLYLIISFLYLVPITGVAQVTTPVVDQPRPSQYFIGSRDQVLMAINVWGFVIKPGQYMVPYNTDLISLLSFAGGPREEAKIKNIRIIRIAENENEKVFTVDVKEFLKTGDPSLNLFLKPGDTVVVSGTTFHLINQLFDFTWRVATIAQVYFLAQWYSQNK
jgi:hypothetical protein